MARKVILVSDVSGQESADVENHEFWYEGKRYEIDCTPEEWQDYHNALAPWVEKARNIPPAGQSAKSGQRRQIASRYSTKPRSQTDESRARRWALENGIPVGSRGRVPSGLVEQWKHATQQQKHSVEAIA